MKRYYIAYGSNLNVQQMRWRCPGARIIGTAELQDYRLLFKGSKTGSYLTVEPEKGCTVPVAVWEVTEQDELALDRYEGYPSFYYKTEMTLDVKGIRTGKLRRRRAFVYIMREERPYGVPANSYLSICGQGYRFFGFPVDKLLEATLPAWQSAHAAASPTTNLRRFPGWTTRPSSARTAAHGRRWTALAFRLRSRTPLSRPSTAV